MRDGKILVCIRVYMWDEMANSFFFPHGLHGIQLLIYVVNLVSKLKILKIEVHLELINSWVWIRTQQTIN